MLAFPQPLDQILDEQHGLPVVNIPEAPEVFDIVLRSIYPGATPPKVTEQTTLTALMLTADKYDISSMRPGLGESLKMFLPSPSNSFWVYIMACRFGFLDVAKEAAKRSTMESFSKLKHPEHIRHVSSTDLYRILQFVQERERSSLSILEDVIERPDFQQFAECKHYEQGGSDYYSLLHKAAGESFLKNPCVGVEDLLIVLNSIPDPPLGCDPLTDWGRCYSEDDQPVCPLRPTTIRGRLHEVVDDLDLKRTCLLKRFFGKDFESG